MEAGRGGPHPEGGLECPARMRPGCAQEVTPGSTQTAGMPETGCIGLSSSRESQTHPGKAPQHCPRILRAIPAHGDPADVGQAQALTPKAPGRCLAGEVSGGDLEAGEALLLAKGPHHPVADQAGRGILAERANAEDVHWVPTVGRRFSGDSSLDSRDRPSRSGCRVWQSMRHRTSTSERRRRTHHGVARFRTA